MPCGVYSYWGLIPEQICLPHAHGYSTTTTTTANSQRQYITRFHWGTGEHIRRAYIAVLIICCWFVCARVCCVFLFMPCYNFMWTQNVRVDDCIRRTICLASCLWISHSITCESVCVCVTLARSKPMHAYTQTHPHYPLYRRCYNNEIIFANLSANVFVLSWFFFRTAAAAAANPVWRPLALISYFS